LSKISHPRRFIPKLKQLCAEAGVALVVRRTPKGCYASGASALVAPDKALLLVSFRHRADDHFWFTVFHELGHLLLHQAQTFVDDTHTPEDRSEQEANKFAQSVIIPESRADEFNSLPVQRDAILRFSVSIGIAPGVTVGQMQRAGRLSFRNLNSLKRHWTWEDIPVVA
jgi:Zn-dependent peptidase ImmA (M78 family)